MKHTDYYGDKTKQPKHTPTMAMTKDQLVKMAYAERVGEKQFISEKRGPMRKDVIIAAILDKRASVALAKGE